MKHRYAVPCKTCDKIMSEDYVCLEVNCPFKEKPVEKKSNEYQVGGDHYSRGGRYQHWDFIEDHGLGYLEGYASKYMVRWRKKGTPVQDLEKAIHCVTKLRELALEGRRKNRAEGIDLKDIEMFCGANAVNDDEDVSAFKALFNWRDPADLSVVRVILNRLLEASPPRRIQRKHEKTSKDGMEHPFGYDADAEKK